MSARYPPRRKGALRARETAIGKIKEVLRLPYELKLSQYQIARNCSICRYGEQVSKACRKSQNPMAAARQLG